MADSLYIPISRPPSSTSQIEAFVTAAFLELGLRPQGFLLGFDQSRREEVTEDPSRLYMVSVTTRGDWSFGGAVAYAFGKHDGRIVFNDAGVLDGRHRYVVDDLRQALVRQVRP